MAFSTAVRRAASSAAPLVARSLCGTHLNYHSAASLLLLRTTSGLLFPKAIGSSFDLGFSSQRSHFSSLLQKPNFDAELTESEIKCAEECDRVSSVNVYYLLAYDTVDDIMWDVLQNKLDNVCQVLDGEQKELEVTINLTSCSPAKQTQSPGKQKTLDTFLKRCPSASDASPKARRPKF